LLVARSYDIDLLYDHAPSLEVRAIVERIRKEMPVEVISGSQWIIALAHSDQITNLKEGDLPCVTNIVRNQQPIDLESYRPSLAQTWEWPEAEDALAACKYSVLLTDFTGSGLSHRDRLRRITAVVADVAEVTDARVCHWRPAGCLVDPATIREKFQFACNVRQFNTDEKVSEALMDTLGLAALGLVDIQCYFRGLDPDRIVPWLFGVAGYVFTNGDVIKDGDTIRGFDPNDSWRCSHRMASVGPERPVIDVDPGSYSAKRVTRHN